MLLARSDWACHKHSLLENAEKPRVSPSFCYSMVPGLMETLEPLPNRHMATLWHPFSVVGHVLIILGDFTCIYRGISPVAVWNRRVFIYRVYVHS